MESNQQVMQARCNPYQPELNPKQGVLELSLFDQDGNPVDLRTMKNQIIDLANRVAAIENPPG